MWTKTKKVSIKSEMPLRWLGMFFCADAGSNNYSFNFTWSPTKTSQLHVLSCCRVFVCACSLHFYPKIGTRITIIETDQHSLSLYRNQKPMKNYFALAYLKENILEKELHRGLTTQLNNLWRENNWLQTLNRKSQEIECIMGIICLRSQNW